MPKFSNRSMTNLNSCHLVLRRVMSLAIEKADFTVLCGHRGQEEQDAAFEAGNSELKCARSKHNYDRSNAVYIAPYPIDWHDEARFHSVAAEVKRAWGAMTDGAKMGYDLSWGGDWVSFRDLPHWELRPVRRS